MVIVWFGIEVLSCWFWAMPTKGLGKQDPFPSTHATPVEHWPHKNRQGVVWKLAARGPMDRRQNAYGLEIHLYVETCFHTIELGECHEEVWWWAHKKGSSAAYMFVHYLAKTKLKPAVPFPWTSVLPSSAEVSLPEADRHAYNAEVLASSVGWQLFKSSCPR